MEVSDLRHFQVADSFKDNIMRPSLCVKWCDLFVGYIDGDFWLKWKCYYLTERQMTYPYKGTEEFPLLGDNELPFLGDKCVALIGGQVSFPYWGTNRLTLLGDK